ncbi:MAG TPA: response regulator [Thermodesulfobacteriota bacterium]|nr:response regulator [Thermodesulfobacteriota bacterium]
MGSRKILVVEDSPTMSQLLTFILKKLKDVEVVAVHDGVNGLKKISEGKYDLILTDINMPLMDGLKFISLVRGDKSNMNKDIPIVIITTEGEEEVRSEGMALGANSYITKPVKAGEVFDTVSSLLKA